MRLEKHICDEFTYRMCALHLIYLKKTHLVRYLYVQEACNLYFDKHIIHNFNARFPNYT